MERMLLMFVILASLGWNTLQATTRGNEILIKSTDYSNSILPFMKEFTVTANITNVAKVSLQNIRMKNIYSDNLSVTNAKINGKTKTPSKEHNVQTLTNTFKPGASILLTLTVIIGKQAPQISSGYHIENLLIRIDYNNKDAYENTAQKLFALPYTKAGCAKRFDVTSGEIRPDYVTASSYYENLPPQAFGEMSSGWCAKDVIGKAYLQILFAKKVRLTYIGIGGRKGKGDWIKEYALRYRIGDTWHDYMENGYAKVFQGSHIIDVKRGWLLQKIECTGLRILPRKISGKLVCLRAAIKGCYISQTDTCYAPIGMESGLIPKASLSDVTAMDDEISPPDDGRLNKAPPNYPHGWKGRSDDVDWLQIDLGSLYKVTRVAIQGAYNKRYYVKSFKLWYSNDTNTWVHVLNNRSKLFEGPRNDDERINGKIVDLPTSIIGRSFRIQPVAVFSEKVMRTELYGCPVREDRLEKEISSAHFPRTVLVDEHQGKIFVCQESFTRSSCYQSEEKDSFMAWKSLPKHILNIIGVDSSNTQYAITEKGSYALKKNVSNNWLVISNVEWSRINSNIERKSVNIPSIIPNKLTNKYQWNLKTNISITVSGIGIHIRNPDTTSWQLRARWACCEIHEKDRGRM